jgi:hypothetical protein
MGAGKDFGWPSNTRRRVTPSSSFVASCGGVAFAVALISLNGFPRSSARLAIDPRRVTPADEIEHGAKPEGIKRLDVLGT